jgi:hypothetical protein
MAANSKSWSATQLHMFSMYAVEFGLKCSSSDAALQFEFTLPVFLGHCSSCKFEPAAPPTRMWESNEALL